jgi:uncharacterized OB-fold protein
MHAIQTRCLKCGSVFSSSRPRVTYCQCCFADECYLKPVLTAGEGEEAQPASSERAEPAAPPPA